MSHDEVWTRFQSPQTAATMRPAVSFNKLPLLNFCFLIIHYWSHVLYTCALAVCSFGVAIAQANLLDCGRSKLPGCCWRKKVARSKKQVSGEEVTGHEIECRHIHTMNDLWDLR
jgi:hypothetical protein